MARQRRGRSRGPELRGTLGTLWRTTLAQAGAVRQVLERGAREGRARLDEARHERKRETELAEFGELVLELIERGEAPELAEHPDVIAALESISAIDDKDRERERGRDRRPVADRDFVAPARRSRFDRDRERDRGGDGDGDDDGAVSSRGWRPPARTSAGDGRVWRPPVHDAEEPTRPEPAPPGRRRDPAKEPGARFQEKKPVPAARRGGIQFDDEDDADLPDYMHPDDVPKK